MAADAILLPSFYAPSPLRTFPRRYRNGLRRTLTRFLATFSPNSPLFEPQRRWCHLANTLKRTVNKRNRRNFHVWNSRRPRAIQENAVRAAFSAIASWAS